MVKQVVKFLIEGYNIRYVVFFFAKNGDIQKKLLYFVKKTREEPGFVKQFTK